ncbi:MAG: class I SAM-dependent methyltransferase [candidate division KSB1 bacterium]|nr:class I SAM-dependent methyltransferase [candidate division KSB1 bacterium]MDZ7317720.1 class I SAM-dependent methyltransferase [candidate division KSB1 bacterium]MDZ7340233.1 class I SAM-dependent methyltransferase [candidate division KSB1 bacterium]
MNFGDEASRWRLKARLYRIFRSHFPFNLIVSRENQNLQHVLQSIAIDARRIAVDVGTGAGNVLTCLCSFGKVIGIDSNFSMLQLARQNFPSTWLIQGDAVRLPLKPAVDLVVAVGLAEYLRDADLLFAEARRILSANGYLMITSAPPGLWTHLRRLLGHRLFPRTAAMMVALGSRNNFRLQRQMRTMMQVQLLFQKV